MRTSSAHGQLDIDTSSAPASSRSISPPARHQVVQKNAALVEEASAAAAAQSMAEQAQTLQDAVAVFKTAETGRTASRAVAPQRELRLPAPKPRTASRTESPKREKTPAASTEGNHPVAAATGAANRETF